MKSGDRENAWFFLAMAINVCWFCTQEIIQYTKKHEHSSQMLWNHIMHEIEFNALIDVYINHSNHLTERKKNYSTRVSPKIIYFWAHEHFSRKLSYIAGFLRIFAFHYLKLLFSSNRYNIAHNLWLANGIISQSNLEVGMNVRVCVCVCGWTDAIEFIFYDGIGQCVCFCVSVISLACVRPTFTNANASRYESGRL